MAGNRQREEEVYESQNDQHLEELHTKLRTLRGITTDIHDDVERQNLMLDDTGDRFSSFGASLAQTSQRAARAFGLGPGGTKQCRIITYIVGGSIALWILWKIGRWWFSGSSPAEDF